MSCSAARTRVEAAEVTLAPPPPLVLLLLLLLLLMLTATATGGDGGELGLAFLDELSDILAVDGGEESRELGIVDLRGDCVFGKKEESVSEASMVLRDWRRFERARRAGDATREGTRRGGSRVGTHRKRGQP